MFTYQVTSIIHELDTLFFLEFGIVQVCDVKCKNQVAIETHICAPTYHNNSKYVTAFRVVSLSNDIYHVNIKLFFGKVNATSQCKT